MEKVKNTKGESARRAITTSGDVTRKARERGEGPGKGRTTA
jgi:hypothetical protein